MSRRGVPVPDRTGNHNVSVAMIDYSGLLEKFPASTTIDEGGSHERRYEFVAAASVPQQPAELVVQTTEAVRDLGHERGWWG